MKQNKPKFINEDTVRKSKNNILLRKVYKSHFTDKIIEKSTRPTKKPAQYIVKHLEKNSEKPYGKQLGKCSMEVQRLYGN